MRFLRRLGIAVASVIAASGLVYAADTLVDEDIVFDKELDHWMYVETSAVGPGGGLGMIAGEAPDYLVDGVQPGGDVGMAGGAWSGGIADGGWAIISGGAGSPGGKVWLIGGPGGAHGGGEGHGGPVLIEGGAAHVNTDGDGGMITIKAGLGDDAGADGIIQFHTGGDERWYVNADGDIIPNDDTAVDLGSPYNRFGYAYISAMVRVAGRTSLDQDGLYQVDGSNAGLDYKDDRAYNDSGDGHDFRSRETRTSGGLLAVGNTSNKHLRVKSVVSDDETTLELRVRRGSSESFEVIKVCGSNSAGSGYRALCIAN